MNPRIWAREPGRPVSRDSILAMLIAPDRLLLLQDTRFRYPGSRRGGATRSYRNSTRAEFANRQLHLIHAEFVAIKYRCDEMPFPGSERDGGKETAVLARPQNPVLSA